MGIIEIDKLDTLLARHAELKVAVDAFGQTLNEVRAYANETNIIVKDILSGKQLSAWINDLAASGKNSATYKDASRMNTLLGSKDACRNNKVSQHIFDFAVANNKTGAYFGMVLDNAGDINWNTLSTPESVCSNVATFAEVVQDEIAYSVSVGNYAFKSAIYENHEITELFIRDSNIALDVMRAQAIELNIKGETSRTWTGKYFVLGFSNTMTSFPMPGTTLCYEEAQVTTASGEVLKYSCDNYQRNIERFAYKLYAKGSGGTKSFGYYVFNFE